MCVGIKESAMKAYLLNNESFLGDPNRVWVQFPVSIEIGRASCRERV